MTALINSTSAITTIENRSLMIMMKTIICLYQLKRTKWKMSWGFFMSFEMSREEGQFACKSGSLVGFGGPQVSQRRPTIHPTVLRPNSPALMPVYFSPPPWQLYQYTTEILVWPYHIRNNSCLEMSRYFMRNSGGNKEDARRRAEVSQDQVSHGLLTTH